MHQIPIDLSLFSFLDDLEFTDAGLAAHPDAAALAKPVSDLIAQCPGIVQKEREARRAVTRAAAVVAVCNDILDSLTTHLGGLVLVEAKQDRKGTFYRRFFPIPPSQFIAQSLRRQCQLTIDAMIPEMKKTPDGSPIKGLAGRMEHAAKAAIDALAARSRLMGERGACASDVQEWKEGVNRMRVALYADLLKRASENGYPRAWADTFFHPDASGATKAVEGPTPGPTPTPAKP